MNLMILMKTAINPNNKIFGLFTAFLFLSILSLEFLSQSCTNKNNKDLQSADSLPKLKDSIYTAYSTNKNIYEGFNSPNAINAIAKIENEYFNNYNKGVSKYYGTSWYYMSFSIIDSLSRLNRWDTYLKEMQAIGVKPDSFHCTIYAIKALEAGMGKEFEKLRGLHQKYWANREFAGWSLAYLLTRYYNWKAYLILESYSPEFKRCSDNFRRRRCYDVWHQPDIHLEKLLLIGKDEKEIDSLLNNNEFGWGFSNQGMHSWITRFDQIKECRWEGAPSKKYDCCEDCSPLFKTHKFLEFKDYSSHLVVFPPLIKNQVSF